MKSQIHNVKSAIRNPKSAISSPPLVSAERVRAYIRSRFNPIRGLTPELLAGYLDSFKTGYVKQAALIWQDIEERDDTVRAVASKRKKAVARHGWEVLGLDPKTAGASPAEIERHRAALEYFYNNLTVTDVLDENQRGEVPLLIRQMMDAVGKRYAVHEIVWKPSPDGLAAELRFVPLWFFENTTGRLRYLRSEADLLGQDLEPDRWLVTVGDGLMYATSVAYIYKNLSLKDWVIYNERHGMPGIHGKTDATKDSDEWDDMVDAVENFAADWSIVTNMSAQIEKVDLGAGGAIPYPPLVDRMSRAISAMWRGADLSTLSASSSEAGQGASLQGSEMEILEQDDAAFISETLSRNLDRRVIQWAFGPNVRPLAYIRIKTTQRRNVDQDLKVDAFLAEHGVPLSIAATAERYGRSLVENPEKEPTLRAPANPLLPPTSEIPNARSSLKSAIRNPQPAIRNPALIAAAIQQVAAAAAQDLAPVRARLQQILTIDDPEFMVNALRNFQRELPDLLRAINADPAAARVIEDTLSAALLTGYTEKLSPSPLPNEFDPSQPRDEQGRWTDTGDGGMEWTTSKGTKVKVEAGGTVEIKGTRFPMKEPGPSALGKDQADKFRRSGMNPDDYRDIGGGMVAHKDDDDRWAEAGRRRKAFAEKVKATKPTPQEDWNNLVLERRHAAEHGSGYMDIYKVERKMDEFKKAHPEYANR